MSIQSEITRLNDAKVDIVQASANLGLEIPAGSNLNTYTEAILTYSQAPGGSKYVQAFTSQTSVTITAATHGCGEAMPSFEPFLRLSCLCRATFPSVARCWPSLSCGTHNSCVTIIRLRMFRCRLSAGECLYPFQGALWHIHKSVALCSCGKTCI